MYEAAGGSEGILRLAEAWHARVMADEIVSHAFSHGFNPQHNERLAAYWAEALGGPAAYSGAYGDETFVVRIHSGNGEHDEMDRRAIACFDQAMQDVGLDANTPVSGGPARLLRLGDHHDDGGLPRICRRRAGGPQPSALVMGRTRALRSSSRFARYYAAVGGAWLWRVRCPSGEVAVVVPSGLRVRVQPQRWMATR